MVRSGQKVSAHAWSVVDVGCFTRAELSHCGKLRTKYHVIVSTDDILNWPLQADQHSDRPMALTCDIIIVNWNGGVLLRDCLDSMTATTGVNCGRVIVVDNASTDGSADQLEQSPLKPIVLRNAENRGFAAACNQGAQGSTADLLLFLNPDTKLFADSLALPLAEMARPEQARVGLLGIQLLDADGVVARSCARFPTPGQLVARSCGLDRLLPRWFLPHFMTEWDHRSTRDVDQPIGAFLLIRRPLFEQLGGFDERFFVYFEDLDLALRARQLGWRALYLATARALHVGGGTTAGIRATRLFYIWRSRIQFAFKHFSPFSAAMVSAATLLVEPLVRLSWGLARRRLDEAGQVLVGTGMLWGDRARRLFNRRSPGHHG